MYGGGHAYQVHEYRDSAVGQCALDQCIVAGGHARQHHRSIQACPPQGLSRGPLVLSQPCLGARLVPALRPVRSKDKHSDAQAELGCRCCKWSSNVSRCKVVCRMAKQLMLSGEDDILAYIDN